MSKKYVPKDEEISTPKEVLRKKQKERYSIFSLTKGYSFSNHTHGRVNYHSIGFNHEPGTL